MFSLLRPQSTRLGLCIPVLSSVTSRCLQRPHEESLFLLHTGGDSQNFLHPSLMGSLWFYLYQHLLKTSFDVVKRWVNEAQEAASSDNIMVQVGSPVATWGITSSCWEQSRLLVLSWTPRATEGIEVSRAQCGFVSWNSIMLWACSTMCGRMIAWQSTRCSASSHAMASSHHLLTA